MPPTSSMLIDNLIDNALVVSQAGSTIDVTITPLSNVDAVDLHVLDEGPGMSPEDRARAFDRFWRGRTDTAGSGLGLAIVAGLARASDATVEFEATHPRQRSRCACAVRAPATLARVFGLRAPTGIAGGRVSRMMRRDAVIEPAVV